GLMHYSQGILHGRKALFLPTGELVEEAFYDQGHLEGPYFLKKTDGTEVISYYKNNKMDGVHQIFYPPHEVMGKVKALEANFKKGLLDGELAKFNEKGIKIF